MNEPRPPAGFPTTRWSLVGRAGHPSVAGARDALEVICLDYWYPLYAFARRRGHRPEEARDLIQGFFADLIERGSLATADRERGRFRAFLRAACGHYLANQMAMERTLKRGGGARHVSIDLPGAEGRYGREPSNEMTADHLFERRWALDLLGNVLNRLEAEMVAAGKAELFARLRPTLEGSRRAYREIGVSLRMTEAAVKVAAHRLRARYRDLLRAEVARTVSDPSDVDAEIDALLVTLTG